VLAAYPNMISQYDLLLPGIENTALMLLISKIKVSNREGSGYAGLMAAIIAQAQIDAKAGEPRAVNWLASEACFEMCFAVGFEHKNILKWLERRELKH